MLRQVSENLYNRKIELLAERIVNVPQLQIHQRISRFATPRPLSWSQSRSQGCSAVE